MNPGVPPNGLFWTTEIPKDSFHVGYGGRIAKLKLRDLCLTEIFQFGGARCIPGLVDCDVIWKATSGPVERGLGTSGSEDEFSRFTGHFADARCIAKASARELGFAFSTNKMTSDEFYASIGPEKNGVFL